MAVKAPDINLDEFITGEKFQHVCDVDAEKDAHYENSIKKSRNNIIIFFTQTHELINRLPIIRKINKKFIVVSHNSDGRFQYQPAARVIDFQWKNEPNIIHWFCQNCEVDEPNVTPIPIAVENTYIFKPEIKQQYMINLRNASIKKEIRMFICYNPGTNPGEREPPLKIFRDKSWVTIQNGFNNIELIKPYFDNMIRHQFVISPDGNGMDTHRLWEALYLGCIPIVKPHVFTEYFAKHLPIIIVNDWEEITLNFLIDKIVNMDKLEYDWEMLKISYWKNKIRGMINGIPA